MARFLWYLFLLWFGFLFMALFSACGVSTINQESPISGIFILADIIYLALFLPGALTHSYELYYAMMYRKYHGQLPPDTLYVWWVYAACGLLGNCVATIYEVRARLLDLDSEAEYQDPFEPY